MINFRYQKKPETNERQLIDYQNQCVQKTIFLQTGNGLIPLRLRNLHIITFASLTLSYILIDLSVQSESVYIQSNIGVHNQLKKDLS